MNKITSKSGMSRLCLMFFILLCSMFKGEYAFTRDHWVKDYMEVTYNRDDRYIIFDFLCYDYSFAHIEKHGYLYTLDFEYSEDGHNFTHLMKVETDYQKCKDWTKIKMKEKKPGVKIEILNCYKINKTIWPDNGKDLNVEVDVTLKHYKRSFHWVKSKRSYMTVKWYLPYTCDHVKSVQFNGRWVIGGGSGFDKIEEVYMLDKDQSTSYRLKNDSSILKSEISNQVKVKRETDAIIVKGALPGENIKVYTISGVEVKSVVATDNEINIKLAKNQIYLVKTGEARYKVVL